MQSALILFPGINRERDMAMALTSTLGKPPLMIWQDETTLPSVDLLVIPGGFSFGDYLRPGAIAARAPVMEGVRRALARGVKVLGVCNGFQILIEAGLLPGALLRNHGRKFVCKTISLEVVRTDTFFTKNVAPNTQLPCPIAHGDGAYTCDDETYRRLEGEGQIVFRYGQGTNPNGSRADIAGICNRSGTVIGLMPHPENRVDPIHGGTDCRVLFESLRAHL